MDENKKTISATGEKDKPITNFIVKNIFVGKKNLTEILTRLVIKETKK